MENSKGPQHRFLQQVVLPRMAALLPKGESCYLVGGAVRDAMLQRHGRDFDFATAFDPGRMARQLAKDLAGHWFFLDEPRRQSRILVDWEGEEITCDFAPFRAETFEEDLLLRDFTINAMARPLMPTGSLGALLDPLNGREDLRKGRLRICSPRVLHMDPLRILKGIRHCLSHDLSIEPKTFQAMRQARDGLFTVSPERVRDEMAKILMARSAHRGLRFLWELRLIEFLFGQPGSQNGFHQGLKYLNLAENWLSALYRTTAPSAIKSVEFVIEPGINRRVALKLGAFCKGYGVSHPGEVLKRWRGSRLLQDTVESLTALSADNAKSFWSLPSGSRGRSLWLEELGGDAEASAMFLDILSDREGCRKIAFVEKTLLDLETCRRQGRIPDLVDGRWLREKLGFREGPEIGKALVALRREEMAGLIENRLDAESFLAVYKEKND